MSFDVLLPRHPNDLLGEIRTSDNTVFFCSKKKVVYTTEKITLGPNKWKNNIGTIFLLKQW